jgi:hypothetical protein
MKKVVCTLTAVAFALGLAGAGMAQAAGKEAEKPAAKTETKITQQVAPKPLDKPGEPAKPGAKEEVKPGEKAKPVTKEAVKPGEKAKSVTKEAAKTGEKEKGKETVKKTTKPGQKEEKKPGSSMDKPVKEEKKL